jgi:hypothetical protein
VGTARLLWSPGSSSKDAGAGGVTVGHPALTLVDLGTLDSELMPAASWSAVKNG